MPPATRKSHPQGMARHPPPATWAKLAGLRAPKLPNHIALTLARGESRLNSGNLGSYNSDYVQLAQILTCVTRLKTRTIPRLAKRGGGGTPSRALFSYNS